MKRFGSITTGTVILALTAGLLLKPGCSIDNDFLGLEDGQRDLLFGALAFALLQAQGDDPAPQPLPGDDGLNCWDLDANGSCDLAVEDTNGDGQCDTADCQGADGADGAIGQDGAPGADGQDGVDGLACWDLNGNGVADLQEDQNGDGQYDGLDCAGADGATGADGLPGSPASQGQPGSVGPEFFSQFIDDFFTYADHEPGELDVGIVAIIEPALGTPENTAGDAGAIAYRFAIPQMYHVGNDVTMRLSFYRTGPLFPGQCLVFTLDALRLRNGEDVAPYGERLWIRPNISIVGTVARDLVSDLLGGLGGLFLVIDIPVNSPAGLDDSVDLVPTDLLALEIATAIKPDLSVWDDGGRYELLGVEFFESAPGTATVAGGTIFTASEEVTCGDCNENGIDDRTDIAQGTSDDCNENGTPDECEMGEPPDHNCCDADHGIGCSDLDIETCVCERDFFCCDGEWDGDCVAEVEAFECGSCTIEGDCNGNGVLDECDINFEDSPDCNSNGVPDECDIENGTSEDCNHNSIPDECDIADGTVEDCDLNNVPDICQVQGAAGFRIGQESAPGAGDFDSNILGILQPFPSSLSAADYYRYSNGFQSSFNGAGVDLTFEQSHIFFVENTDGLSLFVVHDRPTNADGGNASTRYEILGDADGVFRSVEDDPNEGYTGNPGDTVFTANLAWSACCTDGLALTGLDGEWSIITEFTSTIAGMNAWKALTPDGNPIPLALVPGQRVRIDFFTQSGEGDCNGNNVPDICEYAGNDCNKNMVLDECDIADGTSPDCQLNGIPDECDGGCPVCLSDADCEDGDLCTIDTCAYVECLQEPVVCPLDSFCVDGECIID